METFWQQAYLIAFKRLLEDASFADFPKLAAEAAKLADDAARENAKRKLTFSVEV